MVSNTLEALYGEKGLISGLIKGHWIGTKNYAWRSCAKKGTAARLAPRRVERDDPGLLLVVPGAQ